MKSAVAALGVVSILLLSGCVSTAESPVVKTQNSQIEVTPEPSNDEGVHEIIHPVEPVELELSSTEEDVVELTNLWDIAASEFSFEIPQDPRIQAQKRWYLKHPNYMARVSKRAEPFLYHIMQRLKDRGMPMEMVLLPIVESAFDPFAYSHGSAAGMWQFIEGTGRRFGLKQTWWYEGRRDVIASTDAAIDYLLYLNKYFDGDWLHALAAYNSGEGRVKRAIRKNARQGKPTDFWSLELPRETRAYVPKLLALADILKNREEYAFAWPVIPNKPVIEIVDVGQQIDLAIAARFAGLSVEALSALNPGFNRWATDPDGPHQLVLPADAAPTFTTALAESDKNDRLNWARHEIKRGDSLLKIASQYHTTVDVIQQVNQLRGNVIRAGDHLLVPVAMRDLKDYSLSTEQRLAALQKRERSGHQISHTIVSGDTFWDLSRKYDVSTKDLAKWNGMAPGDTLRLGLELVVWIDGPATAESITRKVTYTVRTGDSLSRIANKFNVRVSQLKQWNSLQKQKYLQPGQKLTVIVDVANVAS
ncbi:lytic transglycosylase [Alteromonas facilis]|uniref:lytic transglycosylase n=1 Tax=Alteromonas facilis TaxID=2048004 RepID=UPI000C28D402|nr:LysM peptidoglycan-binding domain-containing protein [Alteromonas facilis]